MKRNPHADIIHAWAENMDLVIEGKLGNFDWTIVKKPYFNPNYEYRIQEKPMLTFKSAADVFEKYPKLNHLFLNQFGLLCGSELPVKLPLNNGKGVLHFTCDGNHIVQPNVLLTRNSGTEHVHAKWLRMLAADSTLKFEFRRKDSSAKWQNCMGTPAFHDYNEYRIKVVEEFITHLGSDKYPKPVKQLDEGEKYWCAQVPNQAVSFTWGQHQTNRQEVLKCAELNLIFTTEKAAMQAAKIIGDAFRGNT